MWIELWIFEVQTCSNRFKTKTMSWTSVSQATKPNGFPGFHQTEGSPFKRMRSQSGFNHRKKRMIHRCQYPCWLRRRWFDDIFLASLFVMRHDGTLLWINQYKYHHYGMNDRFWTLSCWLENYSHSRFLLMVCEVFFPEKLFMNFHDKSASSQQDWQKQSYWNTERWPLSFLFLSGLQYIGFDDGS